MRTKRNTYRKKGLLCGKWWGIFVLSALLQACTRQDVAEETDSYGGKGDVVLRVGMEVPSEEEGKVLTMRVITVAGTKIYQNEVQQNPSFPCEFHLKELSRDMEYRFYVVCNEEALPAGVQAYLGSLKPGNSRVGLRDYVVEDNGKVENRKFPLRADGAMSNGLPISGRLEGVKLEKGDTKLTIPLTFMVAKIQIDVTNNTDHYVQLINGGGTGLTSGVNGFCANKAYLFPQDKEIVPKDVSYAYAPAYTLGNIGHLNSTDKASPLLILYVYPATGATGAGYGMYVYDGYNKRNYEGLFYKEGGNLLRGMYVIANVGVGESPESSWNYTVEDWGEEGIDVPGFD